MQTSRPLTELPQKKMLFVDISTLENPPAKVGGNQEIRSFLMQKARRHKTWTTAKRKSSSNRIYSPKNPISNTRANARTRGRKPIESQKQEISEAGISLDQAKATLYCSYCLAPMGNREYCRTCLPLEICSKLGAIDTKFCGTFDPFGSWPGVAIDPKLAPAVIRDLGTKLKTSLSIDIRQQSNEIADAGIYLALSDIPTMYGAMVWAQMRSYVMGRSSICQLLGLVSRMTEELNQSLADPDTGLSDTNIWSVFSMFVYEELFELPIFEKIPQLQGVANRRAIHLNGLKAMLNMRGGLTALEKTRWLQMFIIGHVVMHSVKNLQSPYIDLRSFVETVSSKRMRDKCPANAGIWKIAKALDLSQAFVEIATDISMAGVELNEWFQNPSSNIDPLETQTWIHCLQYRLLELLLDGGPRAEANHIEYSLTLALLMFANKSTQVSGLVADPLHSVVNQRLLNHLRHSSGKLWARSPVSLLWVVAMGAICAELAAQRSRFISILGTLCRILGCNDFEGFTVSLQSILWTPYQMDEVVIRLWSEMQNESINICSSKMPEDKLLRDFQNSIKFLDLDCGKMPLSAEAHTSPSKSCLMSSLASSVDNRTVEGAPDSYIDEYLEMTSYQIKDYKATWILTAPPATVKGSD